MAYKTNIKTVVFTQSAVLVKEKNLNGFYLQNEGEADLRVFDNILVIPGANFSFSNHPDVTIDEDIQITFTGAGAKKCSVLKQYIERI